LFLIFLQPHIFCFITVSLNFNQIFLILPSHQTKPYSLPLLNTRKRLQHILLVSISHKHIFAFGAFKQISSVFLDPLFALKLLFSLLFRHKLNTHLDFLRWHRITFIDTRYGNDNVIHSISDLKFSKLSHKLVPTQFMQIFHLQLNVKNSADARL